LTIYNFKKNKENKMAANKSAMKRLRTSKKEHIRNKARKSAIFTNEKKYVSAVEANDMEKAQELYRTSCSLLDKAVKSGTIHKNKADRKKSRLAKLLKKAGK
jgi:small subunit ribosomal protein S20